ncbi:MAG: bifunctional diguanylate cyclase/phosphodiesterase [Pseudomonadota bacterium]
MSGTPTSAAISDHALADRVAELERRLATDGLTGARSRDYFIEHYAGFAERHGSLFFIDLDNFKSVNDYYGHSAGDELLRRLVGAIKSVIAPEDFIARIGGDEFVILSRKTGPREVDRLAQAILEACGAAEIQVGELKVSRGASIGCLRLRPGLEVHGAIDLGDTGMRYAKNLGKNQVYHLNTSDDSFVALMPSVDELKLGLERSEVGYYLQPIVCCRRREIAGYEALLRWERPDGQVLPPAQFLDTMTEAYTKDAKPPLEFARQAARWVTQDQGLFCCLNVSMQFLERISDGDAGWIEAELIGDVPRENIVFEITEAVMETAEEAVAKTVRSLRRSGIKIALDDFGVGASNLERLQMLQVDMIKIDRRFVRGIDTDRKTRDLLAGMIEISHKAGALVVCEGIEEARQFDIVRELGADLAQGFFLGKPEPYQRGGSGAE